MQHHYATLCTPPLQGQCLIDVVRSADEHRLASISDQEICEVMSWATKHNSSTGFSNNNALALACRLERKHRALQSREQPSA